MISRLRKGSSLIIILLFVLLFFFGFENTDDYGRPWDEKNEITILLANAKEYAQAPFFRHLFINFQSIPEDIPFISESIEKDHGVAAYYGYLPIYWRVQDSTTAISYSWHLYTYIVWFLSVIFFYLLLKEVYISPVIPPLGAIVYFFTPRLFAESHYNNKDVVFLVFVIVTLYFAVRIMKYLSWRDIILFSIASGFLMNGKILGIAIWGVTGLSMIAHAVVRKNTNWYSYSMKLFAAAVLSLACYTLLTPAAWNDPVSFIEHGLLNATHFSRWDRPILYRGYTIYPAHGGVPYSYLPLWMFITIPVYISLLFLSSGAVYLATLIKKRLKIFEQDREWFVSLFLLIFLFPFLHVVLHAHTTVLYNGWRHCYFLYAPLCICSFYLPDVLLQNMSNKATPGSVRAVFMTAILILAGFITTFTDMIQNRSYEYSYYNRIARCIWSPSDFEGDYWNVSVLPTLRNFSEQNLNEDAPLKIALMRYADGGQLWTKEELQAEGLYQFVSADEADYFLFNICALVESEDISIDEYEMVYSERHFDNDLSAVFIRKSQS